MSSRKSQHPTIVQIADACGFSTATVSLALREHPHVPPQPREKIQAVAREMGYQHNPTLSDLMAYIRRSPQKRGGKDVLALLVSSEEEIRREPSKQKIGMVARAREMGYEVEEFALDRRGRRYDATRVFRQLVKRRIRGVMVYPVEPSGAIAPTDWSSFSAAVSEYSLDAPRLHRVSKDHYENINLAMHHLHGLGYRRIGLAMRNDRDASACHLWQAGFLVHNARRNGENVAPLIRRRLVRETFLRWLDRQRPDVLLTAEDRRMAPILDLLSREGIWIPDELGYATLNIVPAVRHVTGIDPCDNEVGRALVDLTVSLIHGRERGVPEIAKTILVGGKWCPGTTVRKARPVDAAAGAR